MALSEREQKLLEQMEQALYAEDPRFATKIQSHGSGRSKRRMVLGFAGVVVGLGLVLLAVLNQMVWLGALGFAVMVAGAVYAFTGESHRGISGTVGDDGAVQPTGTVGSKGRSKPRGGFMDRLEQRWERRDREQW